MKRIALLLLMSFFSFSNLFAQVRNNEDYHISEFKDGLAIVTDTKSGKKGLINSKYDLVTGVEYAKVIYLGRGCYRIVKVTNRKEKSGFVGNEGQLLVKAKYDEIWIDKKPTGEPKIVMTRGNDKIWTLDNGSIVRDWSL